MLSVILQLVSINVSPIVFHFPLSVAAGITYVRDDLDISRGYSVDANCSPCRTFLLQEFMRAQEPKCVVAVIVKS